MPTFDGDNLLIILDSGVPTVNVRVDLYSDWKEWYKTGTNSKYPIAFRSIAGDPKGSIFAAPTFFLQNQSGWRIRPAEEDGTVTLVGDLQVEDTSLTGIVPTLGNFRVLVLGAVETIVGIDTQNALLAAIDGLLSDVEGGFSHKDVMRILLSSASGHLSIDPDGTVHISNRSNTKDRITASTSADGERTSVVLDATD